MSVHIVRLGTPRAHGEGPRLGTVRRPPRGVPKAEFASRDYYDVWYPLLAPSEETVKLGYAAKTDAQWKAFERKYRAEMKTPYAARTIAMLAVLSRHADIAVGCYCADESRCHRSLLRSLLQENGAQIAPESAHSGALAD
jgi:uncharacterized protein YeaO (DUF488 family)